MSAIDTLFNIYDTERKEAGIPDGEAPLIEHARTELTELRKDRERLELLLSQLPAEIHEHKHPSTHEVTSYVVCLTRPNGLPVIFQEDTPRAAIDAALLTT